MQQTDKNQAVREWVAQLGPRQAKLVIAARRACDQHRGTYVEITDHGSHTFWSPFSDPCASSPERLAWQDTHAAGMERIQAAFPALVASNYREAVAALDVLAAELRAMPLPTLDSRTTLEERQERERAERARQEAAEAANARELAQRLERGEERRTAPAGAALAIVARLNRNETDLMTDYHGYTTQREVVIGWTTSGRISFPAMRAACARQAEDEIAARAHVTTEDAMRAAWRAYHRLDGTPEALAAWESEHGASARGGVEHRENWSMGGGLYLGGTSRHADGWQIVQTPPSSSPVWATRAAILDPHKHGATSVEASNAGGYTVQSAENKRGTFWIAIPAERVERDVFESERDRAKSAGGWYSRKWGRTPGGFGFATKPEAVAFAEGGAV